MTIYNYTLPQPYRQIAKILTQNDELEDNDKAELGRTTIRIALAAIGLLATYQLGISIGLAVTAGAVLSPPALAIAAGSWLIYNAIVATTTAISCASFAGLGTAIAGGAAGVYILEHTTTTGKSGYANENFDDFIKGPVGLIENIIYNFTE